MLAGFTLDFFGSQEDLIANNPIIHSGVRRCATGPLHSVVVVLNYCHSFVLIWRFERMKSLFFGLNLSLFTLGLATPFTQNSTSKFTFHLLLVKLCGFVNIERVKGNSSLQREREQNSLSCLRRSQVLRLPVTFLVTFSLLSTPMRPLTSTILFTHSDISSVYPGFHVTCLRIDLFVMSYSECLHFLPIRLSLHTARLLGYGLFKQYTKPLIEQ